MKHLVFALAALGLFTAAMPNRADAYFFMRGYIRNMNNNPFTIDSVYMYHNPGFREFWRTPFFGGHAQALDSFDFRASGWPTPAIKQWLSRSGIPVGQLDSFPAVRGQWHTWHYAGTWESCAVMYDSMPPAGVQESNPVSSLRLQLNGATPNPFTDYTTIEFAAPEARPVELTVYNLAGRPVRTLVAGLAPAGSRTAVWNGADDAGRAVESGIYFCRLSTPEQTLTEKLILDR